MPAGGLEPPRQELLRPGRIGRLHVDPQLRRIAGGAEMHHLAVAGDQAHPVAGADLGGPAQGGQQVIPELRLLLKTLEEGGAAGAGDLLQAIARGRLEAEAGGDLR